MARSYSIAAGGFCSAQAQRCPASGFALRLAAMQLDMAHLGFGGMHLVEAALDRAIAAGLTLQQLQDCQSGRADICKASRGDGVVCPDDSCDIDDGVRACG